eukprot:gene10983-7627_t
MTLKKKTFKQRIRQNDLKLRHKISSQMRDRIGAARRRHNRYDRIDDGGRPLDEIVDEIAEGSAVPVQETMLDPRRLTNLLLQSSATLQKTKPQQEKEGEENEEQEKGKSSSSTKRPAMLLSDAPLPADHPLALPDTKILEEAEASERRRAEEEAQQRCNKNQYRHHGQAHVFWERAGLHPLLLRALRSMRFTHPTPTQEAVLPAVLEAEEKRMQRERQLQQQTSISAKRAAASQDKDVLVSAETGSGKTLVFALPMLQRLFCKVYPDDLKKKEEEKSKGGVGGAGEATADPPAGTKKKRTTAAAAGAGEAALKKSKKDDGSAVSRERPSPSTPSPSVSDPYVPIEEDKHLRLMSALVLSPTRELALQILQTFKQLCQHAPAIRVGCIVGGMAAEKQQRILNQQPHVLICTPGRLWELVQKNEGCYLGHSISRRLTCVVLDEADRMLYAGKSFEELKQLLDRIHCEILPAGFVQEREEGAETGEHDELEAGRWDETLQKFVSFKEAEKKLQNSKKKPTESGKKKKTRRGVREEEEEEDKESQQSKGSKQKKAKQKSALEEELEAFEAEEDEEFEDDEEDEEEVEEEGGQLRSKGRKKDEPRPMPMPPDPLVHHRVVTYVTSATLALQTNYERRDFSARKSIIRTNNADMMGKVLQELAIKPSNALVFNVAASESGVASKINETYLRCPDESKDLYMYYFLKTYAKKDRTILFVNAISMLRRLVKIIEILGISVVGLHASMQQRQRLKFIDRFKRGDIKVLVATDVASRGLDIEDVRYVLHFQVPRSTDAYIHRCGRTARCGGTGLSLLLVNAQEHVSFRKLLQSTGRKESDLETFALQPTVVHQLHAHLRIALQIDKLTKEINKSRAKNTWVSRMSKQAEIDASDMIDDEADEENRQKTKAIKALTKELQLLQRKFTGGGGKGAFRTGSYALGAQLAEKKLTERAQRQTFLKKK